MDRDILDEDEFIPRLTHRNEEKRYEGLMLLKEYPKSITPTLMRLLEKLEDDPSRPVRQLARELYRYHAAHSEVEAKLDLEAFDDVDYPGSPLLSLISFGSALSGIFFTIACLLHYYVMGRFPFPAPFQVLLATNMVLTIPYCALGLLLLFPGRGAKRFGLAYAYFSLVLALVLIVGLGRAFHAWWAVHFTLDGQARFAFFLNPFQVTTLLSPLLAGQVLFIYYGSQYLGRAAPDAHSKEDEDADRDADAKPVDSQDVGR